MRPALPALLILAALPAAAADTLDETHFSMNFCWERTYSTEHLAEHPEQTVTRMRIDREPAGHPVAPGETVMEIAVTFRGADGSRVGEEAKAIGYCRPDRDRLDCQIEGDAGDYRLTADPEGVLLTVGERGMLLETRRAMHDLRADEGDDRTFVLRRCG